MSEEMSFFSWCALPRNLLLLGIGFLFALGIIVSTTFLDPADEMQLMLGRLMIWQGSILGFVVYPIFWLYRMKLLYAQEKRGWNEG